jgi:hypothetical protein
MKTEFRITTIIFAIGLLGACATIPALILSKGDINNLGGLPTGVIVFLVLFGSLFIGGVAGLIWFTLKIDIDLIADRVSFHYPFRFQKFTYEKEGILGFRYKYLSGKVSYKSLKFRTKGDKRTFSISDFETSNLRDLEKFALQHFDLRAGKEFTKLVEDQKETEVEISKAFDYEQAKDIRFYLGMIFLFITAILSVLTYQILTGKVRNVNGVTIAIGVMLIIAILTMKRFLKIHARLKNGAQHNA